MQHCTAKDYSFFQQQALPALLRPVAMRHEQRLLRLLGLSDATGKYSETGAYPSLIIHLRDDSHFVIR